jgi:hypothetical protein
MHHPWGAVQWPLIYLEHLGVFYFGAHPTLLYLLLGFAHGWLAYAIRGFIDQAKFQWGFRHF